MSAPFLQAPDYDPAALSALVPDHLQAGLRRFIESGVRPGSGLSAIISNAPLREALAAMDEVTLLAGRQIVLFLHNYAPSSCWGSNADFERWIDAGGLRGKCGS